jgi:hypothetical protein
MRRRRGDDVAYLFVVLDAELGELAGAAMTVLFYAAMHEIHAALVVSRERPRTHTDRLLPNVRLWLTPRPC